jgi:hypothetical protein
MTTAPEQDTIATDQWARHHQAYGPQSWGAEATQPIPAVPVEDDRAAFTQGFQRPLFYAPGGPVGPSNFIDDRPAPPAPPKPKSALSAWLIVAAVIGTILIGLAVIALATIDTSELKGGTFSPVQTKGTDPEGEGQPKVLTKAAEKKAVTKVKPFTPAGPVVGKPFRAGDFQFTVHAKKCGLVTAGTNPYLKTRAQGSFCRLDITAKNVTDSPAYFSADDLLTAKDKGGREFSADVTANTYGNDSDSAGFYKEINPGNKVRSFVYFDLPKGAALSSVTFRSGLFSDSNDATLTF